MDKRQKVIAGLRDAIAFAKGDRSRARVTRYDVPQSIDVKKLRERLNMSQPEFALKFGFSLGTLRQWEQGRRTPEGPARVLLTVISHSPTAVKKALETEARKVVPSTKTAAISKSELPGSSAPDRAHAPRDQGDS